MNQHLRGALLCLTATIAWGAMFPVMNGALQRIDPFTFTLFRYSIAALLFLGLLVAREGRPALSVAGQRPMLAWLFGSAGFAGFGFLVFWGQQLAGREGVLTASIIMATQPMLGLLVNWRLRGVVPRRVSLAFVALSFCGVALVVTGGDLQALIREPVSYKADALIFLGALCWVLYTVGGSYFPQWSAYKYTAMTTLLGLTTVAAVEAALLASGFVTWPAARTVLGISPNLAYMAVVAGFIAVLAWNMGNKTLGPTNAVLFMDVIPITAFTISALQGSLPSSPQLVGASLTAAALIGNNLYLRLTTAPARVLPQPAESV